MLTGAVDWSSGAWPAVSGVVLHLACLVRIVIIRLLLASSEQNSFLSVLSMRRAATPISISSFEVDGNQKTHLSLFQNEFNQASRAKDLRELEKYLGLATQRLRSMDIFSMVDIQLTVLSDRPQMKELSVLVKVKEKNVPTLKVI